MPDPIVQTGTEGALRYVVSLPPTHAEPSGPVPVLCFLHGRDEASTLMPVEQSARLHGPLATSAWRDARDRFVIIEPQRPDTGDGWAGHAAAVVALVRRLRSEHAGDPRRTYLTGFSFGGNGVIDFAAAGDGDWAAYWSVDPTRLPPVAPPPVPMWVSAGPLTKRNAGYTEMRSADADGDFRVSDESDDHVEAARKAYARAEVYEWMLQHQH